MIAASRSVANQDTHCGNYDVPKRVDTGTTSAVILGLLTSIGFRIRFGGITVALIVANAIRHPLDVAATRSRRPSAQTVSSWCPSLLLAGQPTRAGPSSPSAGERRPAEHLRRLRRAMPGRCPVSSSWSPSDGSAVCRRSNATLSCRKTCWSSLASAQTALKRAGRIVRDPTIVRAEAPDASGLLSGQVLRRTNTTFVITIPVPSTVQELRIYKPRWTGASFVLDPARRMSFGDRALTS